MISQAPFYMILPQVTLELYSSIINFTVPSGAPFNLSLMEKTSTSLSIAWEEPSPESHNGILIKYLGMIIAVADTDFAFNTTSNGTNMTLDGLLPHMDYGFQVAALNSIGIGPFSASLLKRTAEDGMLY